VILAHSILAAGPEPGAVFWWRANLRSSVWEGIAGSRQPCALQNLRYCVYKRAVLAALILIKGTRVPVAARTRSAVLLR